MTNAQPITWRLPYETVEWIGPLTVTANGTPVTNYKVCILADGIRPTSGDWADPTPDGGSYGVMYNAAGKGSWRIWAKYTTALETVILDDVGLVVAH